MKTDSVYEEKRRKKWKLKKKLSIKKYVFKKSKSIFMFIISVIMEIIIMKMI